MAGQKYSVLCCCLEARFRIEDIYEILTSPCGLTDQQEQEEQQQNKQKKLCLPRPDSALSLPSCRVCFPLPLQISGLLLFGCTTSAQFWEPHYLLGIHTINRIWRNSSLYSDFLFRIQGSFYLQISLSPVTGFQLWFSPWDTAQTL